MQATLTSQEGRLLTALREIPESPLRDDLMQLIDRLLAFAGAPGCAEMQADGAPCATAKLSCDRCEKVRSVLLDLDQKLVRR
jgi:hypothetical protein